MLRTSTSSFLFSIADRPIPRQGAFRYLTGRSRRGIGQRWPTASRVAQRPPDQLLGQVDRHLADVAAQLGDNLLSRCLELLVAGCDDPIALRLRGRGRIGNDLLTLRTSLVADGRALRGHRPALAVGRELGVGLCLRRLGALDTALDRLASLVEHLLVAGDDVLPEDEEDEGERDQRPDDVVGVREERVVLLPALGRQEQRQFWLR